jgi:hypothetical protein
MVLEQATQVISQASRGTPRKVIAENLGMPIKEVDEIIEAARMAKVKGVKPKLSHDERRKRLKDMADGVKAGLAAAGSDVGKRRVVEDVAKRWGVSVGTVIGACKLHKVATGRQQKPAGGAKVMYKIAADLIRGRSMSEVAQANGLSRQRVEQLRDYMRTAGLFGAVLEADKSAVGGHVAGDVREAKRSEAKRRGRK